MKVLQINCVFRYGSTGRIVDDLHNGMLERGHESVVIYGRGVRYKEKNIHKISTEIGAKIHSLCSLLFGVRFGFSPVATHKAISIIKKEKPDVVHLHCLNANFINVYKIIEYLKKAKIKTILTLHAEIMHTAGCEHAMECEKWKTECSDCPKIRGLISKSFRDDAKYCFNRMKKAIQGSDNLTVVGVSEWLTERAEKSPIMQDIKLATVRNGVDTEAFRYTDPEVLRKKLGIPEDKKIILHVTPDFNSPVKGGKYVVEAAKEFTDYQFIIVGYKVGDLPLCDNIITINHTKSKKELAEYYSMSDLTLLTSKRETFSMVVAESLCCGTPVAGFEAGGPESIALSGCCEFVAQGDFDKLAGAIKKILYSDVKREEISGRAAAAYSVSKMVSDYLKIYGE